ncbi:AraC-like DNA-binding protein [Inhella inkyongensis]|uniref:AraC-like DNA-binding protein n=1 Tax=Inhella inkyongensis TaxID=392593 RepID=A0A840S327_9BURK|nr:helix-turn-helix transcriptional regulator [Inhella inkyongensis]MBB5203828.1 AraC-like DNA-binding protein [Inhella inkyongensis]
MPASSTSRPARRRVVPLDPRIHAPSRQRPLRASVRRMAHDMDIHPHRHAWGQLVFSMAGAVRVEAVQDEQALAFIVPPARAVWIPGGVEHAVRAIEQADLRTVYVDAACALEAGTEWQRCRVLDVSALLRELIRELAQVDQGRREPDPHEALLAPLILAELRRAKPVALGLALPRDKRLRRLCEAALAEPQQDHGLRAWSQEVGASERTLHRLFREQLGTSYRHWRSQLLLAQGLSLAARGLALQDIAAELGYASPSAFSAMVKRSVGQTPSEFFKNAGWAGSAASGS